MAAAKKPLVIPALDMFDAINSVINGMSKDDTRPHIACVHVRSISATKTPKGEAGQLDVVATNGHVIYRWKQRLDGAPNRAFSLTRACVKRIKRELADVRREFLVVEKRWKQNNAWKDEKKRKPKPEEPTIAFFDKFYRHPLGGEMRLDVVDEKYPSFDKIFDNFKPRPDAPLRSGINSAYVVQACKNLQVASGNKSIGICIEYDKGDPTMAMVRFTVPEAAMNGGTGSARHVTCLVMPMRI